MASITIKINMDNAAFEGSREQEVNDILQGFLDKGMFSLRGGSGVVAKFRDTNGNTVGTVEIEED